MVLPYPLERVISIDASPDTVFNFFTDPELWAKWWGTGSTIEPRAGGRLLIHHANGVEVTGEVLEVDVPNRIVFTYGYTTGTMVGQSRVTIGVEPAGGSTRVRLVHEFEEETARDQHVQGWRHQLALLANVVTDFLHQGAPTLIDRWFAAWSSPDRDVRERTFEALATPAVRVEDRFSRFEGLEDLFGHVRAVQQFMPGIRIERRGVPRRSQWTVLADWAAVADSGEVRSTGTNVFTFDGSKRIDSVIGVWDDTPRAL